MSHSGPTVDFLIPPRHELRVHCDINTLPLGPHCFSFHKSETHQSHNSSKSIDRPANESVKTLSHLQKNTPASGSTELREYAADYIAPALHLTILKPRRSAHSSSIGNPQKTTEDDDYSSWAENEDTVSSPRCATQQQTKAAGLKKRPHEKERSASVSSLPKTSVSSSVSSSPASPSSSLFSTAEIFGAELFLQHRYLFSCECSHLGVYSPTGCVARVGLTTPYPTPRSLFGEKQQRETHPLDPRNFCAVLPHSDTPVFVDLHSVLHSARRRAQQGEEKAKGLASLASFAVVGKEREKQKEKVPRRERMIQEDEGNEETTRKSVTQTVSSSFGSISSNANVSSISTNLTSSSSAPFCGPRVMICGSPCSGKRTLSQALLNYGVRAGYPLTYVDLDPSHPLLGLPESMSVSHLNATLHPSRIFTHSPAFSVFYGFAHPQGNWSFYVQCVRRLASVTRQYFVKHAKEKERWGGLVVRIPSLDLSTPLEDEEKHSSISGLRSAISETEESPPAIDFSAPLTVRSFLSLVLHSFDIDTVFCVGNEQLIHEVKRCSPKPVRNVLDSANASNASVSLPETEEDFSLQNMLYQDHCVNPNGMTDISLYAVEPLRGRHVPCDVREKTSEGAYPQESDQNTSLFSPFVLEEGRTASSTPPSLPLLPSGKPSQVLPLSILKPHLSRIYDTMGLVTVPTVNGTLYYPSSIISFLRKYFYGTLRWSKEKKIAKDTIKVEKDSKIEEQSQPQFISQGKHALSRTEKSHLDSDRLLSCIFCAHSHLRTLSSFSHRLVRVGASHRLDSIEGILPLGETSLLEAIGVEEISAFSVNLMGRILSFVQVKREEGSSKRKKRENMDKPSSSELQSSATKSEIRTDTDLTLCEDREDKMVSLEGFSQRLRNSRVLGYGYITGVDLSSQSLEIITAFPSWPGYSDVYYLVGERNYL